MLVTSTQIPSSTITILNAFSIPNFSLDILSSHSLLTHARLHTRPLTPGIERRDVESPSLSQKTNERCKYAAFRFIHQCEYPCGNIECVRGEIKSQVQVRSARCKRKSQLSNPIHSTPTPHSRLKIPVFRMNYWCWKPGTRDTSDADAR